MMEEKSTEEKRRCHRYEFRDIAYAIVNSKSSMVGHLLDISRGGIAFSYIGSNYLTEKNPSIDIFLYYMNLYIEAIPVSVITNFPLTDPLHSSKVPMMRCGIQFCEMPGDQQDKIQCILNSLMEKSRN